MPRKQSADKYLHAIYLALLIVGLIGAKVVNGYSVYDSLAPKTYVDKGLERQQRYTDDKAANTLKEAFEHSDMNKQTMLNEMKAYGSDIKAQGVKIDMVLDSVRQLQEAEAFPRRGRK